MRLRFETSRLPAPSGWLTLLVAAAIYAALLLLVVAWRAESGTDFRDFWENAVHFRQTGAIASHLGVHNYLPFFTVFMLPWSFLPLRLAVVLFTLLSLGLFAISVALVETLLAGGLGRRPRGALLATLLLALPYLHSGVVLGSVGLLLLFLILSAWFLLERGREWPAGVALGLAVLVKLLPAVLILFFLLKQRWRVVTACLVTVLVLGLGLPWLAIGYRQCLAEHRDFYTRAVSAGSAISTLTSTQPLKASYSNSALPIVLRRLLSPVDAAKEDATRPLLVNFADAPRGLVLAAYLLLVALLVGTTALATRASAGTWPPDSAARADRVRAQFGLWCSLMLLVSPLVWTHYLVLEYWPLALLSNRVWRTGGAAGGVCRVSAAALLLWLVGALLLVWPAARAAGAQMGAVLVLWLALVAVVVRPLR